MKAQTQTQTQTQRAGTLKKKREDVVDLHLLSSNEAVSGQTKMRLHHGPLFSAARHGVNFNVNEEEYQPDTPFDMMNLLGSSGERRRKKC